MRPVGALAAAAAAVLLAAPAAGAQGYFGQNHVQYDTFRWRVIETEHFQVHYYPEIEDAARMAASMAERSYERLSRVIGHRFREKKPIVLFASRTDFAQNNMFGDLGEGVAGVTDALRQRNVLFFTGQMAEFEHILTHEMVHVFQYDIFSRGQAGANLQVLAQVQPPLWFIEGMAEYLSVGPDDPNTDAIMRDAALSGELPTIEEMTRRPDMYFPYRYGQSFWRYVGQRWGDASIGAIMNALPNIGVERAFKRELGIDLDEIGDEWREWVQAQQLPSIAERDRARRFAEPLLTEKRTGGAVPIYVAPTYSPDASQIAYISTGSYLRGEVFLDLYLADARTGKRLQRLTRSVANPDQEELRYGYSQSAFSPDGRFLAFTAQRQGKDVLNLLDIRRRNTVRRYDTDLEQMLGPSFSPDGQRIVFQGMDGGTSDLYIIDVGGGNLRRLTNDAFGDAQPSWSPDGRRIAFVSERGPQSELDLLHFGETRVSILDLETNEIVVLPAQAGRNINPQWSPDGDAVAFVSDRTGVPNLFLYDFEDGEHYQLTDVFTAISSFTAVSPAITWARTADKLAFVYFEEGDYTVWSITNPRKLKTTPFRETVAPGTIVVTGDRVSDAVADTLRQPVVAAGALVPDSATADTVTAVTATADTATADTATADTATADTATAESRLVRSDEEERRRSVVLDSQPQQLSVYRSAEGLRSSETVTPGSAGAGGVSVAALLDSAELALPDTSTFLEYEYSGGFRPEAVSQPSIGYTNDNFGRGVYGGTTVILSDLLGNQRMALGAAVNGRFEEAQLFAAYTNFARRFQYTVGAQQAPQFFFSGATVEELPNNFVLQTQSISRYISRDAFFIGRLPRNRFTRFEIGGQYSNLNVATLTYENLIDFNTFQQTGFRPGRIDEIASVHLATPVAAYVSDNTLFGYTGPIMGRRYRFEVAPTFGTWRWVDYNADYRRYDPILFNILTVATRVQTAMRVGPDEQQFRRSLGRPELIRGYDREFTSGFQCIEVPASQCTGVDQLIGSRIAFANAELRFPILRGAQLGILPAFLPPIDGLVFYDAGVAWSSGQEVRLSRSRSDDPNVRSLLTSYGAGIRMNLFGFAILRWDYTIPLDQPGRKGYWYWTIGPSF